MVSATLLAAPAETDVERAPTLEDAQQVAQWLHEKYQIPKILLFGSVAKGTATVNSDIDLVLIYDDLDYNIRFHFESELKAQSGEYSGFSTDVILTDRPEWKCRTQQVLNCFEAAIAPETIVLLNYPAQAHIKWAKQIGRYNTMQQEAEEHLKDLCKSIRDSQHNALAKEKEISALVAEKQNTLDQLKRERLVTVCGDLALVIEHGLKGLIAVSGGKLRWTHDGIKLANRVPEHLQPVCQLVPKSILKELYKWREASTYHKILAKMEITTEELHQLVIEYSQVAERFSRSVTNAYEEVTGQTKVTLEAKAECDFLANKRAQIDLWHGVPVDVEINQPQHYMQHIKTVTPTGFWAKFFSKLSIFFDQSDNGRSSYQPDTKSVQPYKLVPKCGVIGPRSKKPCILPPHHKGPHRY